MSLKRRITDMTEPQRQLIDTVRTMLQAHFPGERICIDVPKMLSPQREERRQRIAQALLAGDDVKTISRREEVSIRTIQVVRRGVIRSRKLPP